MPEFLTLLLQTKPRALLLSHLSAPIMDSETIDVTSSLGRVLAEDIYCTAPLA